MNVGFISLGCAKNQVDTEIMMAYLKKSGHTIVNSLEKAEAIVINTCGFITPAKEEAINTIIETGRLKEKGVLKCLIAAGCLSQRYGQVLLDELPELDGLIGIANIFSIEEVLNEAEKGQRLMRIDPPPETFLEKGDRLVSTPPGSAYLKIAEGCDNHCTYCTIPLIRGKYRSRPVEDLLLEAEELTKRGIREITLIAQDTAEYGCDLYGERRLPDLLKKLAAVEDLAWIRMMYLHPAHIDRELIQLISKEKKVLPYLDIPIQHFSDKILKKMNRKHGQKQLAELFADLRDNIEGLVLRTTVMLGFPGENEEDFEQLYEFLEETEFDWLGAFSFVPEEGTPAKSMPGEVDEDTKQDRINRILRLQQKISRKKNVALIDSREKILISSRLKKDLYLGRAYFQAPEVDGKTMVKTDAKLKKGEFVDVCIKGVRNYDLVGEIVNESTK